MTGGLSAIRGAALVAIVCSAALAFSAWSAATARAFSAWSAATARAADGRERPLTRGKTWIWNFAADTLGQAPAKSVVRGGVWTVLQDSTSAAGGAAGAASGAGAAPGDSGVGDAPAGPRVLRQVEDEDGLAFHFIQFPKPFLRNLEASVRFRIRSGEIDPTAGLAFHLDAKGRNGYIVRVSGASGEMTVHYLIYGKRRDIQYGRIEPPEPGAWHTLGVRKVGSVLEATYDGTTVLTLRDERHSGGNVGLWTEDDTIVDFADLTVRSLGE